MKDVRSRCSHYRDSGRTERLISLGGHIFKTPDPQETGPSPFSISGAALGATVSPSSVRPCRLRTRPWRGRQDRGTRDGNRRSPWKTCDLSYRTGYRAAKAAKRVRPSKTRRAMCRCKCSAAAGLFPQLGLKQLPHVFPALFVGLFIVLQAFDTVAIRFRNRKAVTGAGVVDEFILRTALIQGLAE